MMNRRFFNKSIIGAVGASLISKGCTSSKTENDVKLDELTLLFHGDSITDAGRVYTNREANGSLGLGSGYVNYIAMELLGRNNQVKIFNRAGKGHRTTNLLKTWDKKCINLKPDIVSILIGVNDFRTTLLNSSDSQKEKFIKQFESNYRRLLDETIKKLKNVKLILIEPFYIKGGSEVNDPSWSTDYQYFQKITKALSEEYGTIFIPLQKIFNEALETAAPNSLSIDGIHPTLAGHYLIAQSWLSYLIKINKSDRI